MNEFFKKIFGTSSGSVEITLFSVWHILWFVLIFGLTIGAYFLLRNKSEKTIFGYWLVYFRFLYNAILTRQN